MALIIIKPVTGPSHIAEGCGEIPHPWCVTVDITVGSQGSSDIGQTVYQGKEAVSGMVNEVAIDSYRNCIEPDKVAALDY